MSAIAQSTSSPELVELTPAQEAVAKGVKNISMALMQTVITLVESGANQQTIQSDFAKRSGILLCALDLTATDAKTTRIFNKLISSTIIHINNFSPPIQFILSEQNEEEKKTILTPYVFPEARVVVTTLREKDPAALEDESIWAEVYRS